MSAALWQDILSTLDGITALVDATLPPAGADAGPDALTALSAAIGARMDALGITLAATPSAQAMTQTLVLYLDEHVMAQLTVPDRLSWPLLQERALPSEDGGDVFYDRLDRLLRPPAAASMLLEVYAYCLDAGFRGKYDDSDKDKARIAKYQKDIAAVLAPAVPSTSSAGGAGGASTPKLPASGPSAVLYYAVTALIVTAICVAPMLLSNL